MFERSSKSDNEVQSSPMAWVRFPLNGQGMLKTNTFASRSSFAWSSLSSALIQIVRARFCDANISVVQDFLPSMYRSYAVELRNDRDRATTNPRMVSRVAEIPTVKQTRERRSAERNIGISEIELTIMNMSWKQTHCSGPKANKKQRKNQPRQKASVDPQKHRPFGMSVKLTRTKLLEKVSNCHSDRKFQWTYEVLIERQTIITSVFVLRRKYEWLWCEMWNVFRSGYQCFIRGWDARPVFLRVNRRARSIHGCSSNKVYLSGAILSLKKQEAGTILGNW